MTEFEVSKENPQLIQVFLSIQKTTSVMQKMKKLLLFL